MPTTGFYNDKYRVKRQKRRQKKLTSLVKKGCSLRKAREILLKRGY